MTDHPIIQAKVNAAIAGVTKATVPVVARPFDPASIKPVNPNSLALVPADFWKGSVSVSPVGESLYSDPQDMVAIKGRYLSAIPMPSSTKLGYSVSFSYYGQIYSFGREDSVYSPLYEKIQDTTGHEYTEISNVPVPSVYAHLSTFKPNDETATTASVYQRLTVSTRKAATGYEQWVAPTKTE
ncbi:MAG: hypothetical protein EXS67_03540 [Candidatus Margulisbacteria bacterium]|nr:hypothetical protein [Candidatus Margulisiibacteriota bacterium]